jgi:hypothetical protein
MGYNMLNLKTYYILSDVNSLAGETSGKVSRTSFPFLRSGTRDTPSCNTGCFDYQKGV